MIVHRANILTVAVFSGVASLGTLGIALGATAESQQTESANLQLGEIGNSDVSGTAALRDVEGGENVPVTIPLDPILANEDGTGSTTTIIENATIGQLLDRSQQRVILVHDEAYEGEGVPPAITCADVNAARGGQTTMKESTQPLPASGGTPVGSWLLPAAALLVGSAVLGCAVLRRR